jgi:cell division transport system permease protein
MKIKTFGHFFKDGIKSVYRNKLMSIASIMTVTAALFILGIFMALVLNVNSLAGSVIGKIEIQGFLKTDVTTVEQHILEKNISNIEGVKSVEFISKDESLKRFKKWLGKNESLANGLEIQNPLPPSFIIKVKKAESVNYVTEALTNMNIFEKINDGRTIVDQVIRISRFIKIASFVLMLILGIVAISLISNTIKLTVYARKKEIGIMKYIGATDWFIRWPFIVEGITLGFFGGLVSVLMLWGCYAYVVSLISKNWLIIPIVPVGEFMNTIGFTFCLLGLVIGGSGSTLSIRRFLVK